MTVDRRGLWLSLVLLVLASIASWTIIFRKFLSLRRAQAESVRFLETFWRSKRLDSIFGEADKMPLSLQDHGHPVRYRNVWIRPLAD